MQKTFYIKPTTVQHAKDSKCLKQGRKLIVSTHDLTGMLILSLTDLEHWLQP